MSATAVTGQGSPDDVTDQGRMIDPRGHRFGAAMSILAIAFVADLPVLVAFLALALGASAAFGTRYSILGRPWPYVRKALRLAPPKELEHEYPPRFAQGLGFVGFAFSAVLFLVGFATLGWVVAAAVGALQAVLAVRLQAVLAVSGYCLGCRMYFLKWWVPAQFQKLARKTTLA